jgi:hypothetical protein
MNAYDITDYTYKQAKRIGVNVRPSTRKNKKIDVIKNGKIIASVGALGYKDYPTWLKEKGKIYADKRKKAYKARHQKYRTIKWSNSWFADQLLW